MKDAHSKEEWTGKETENSGGKRIKGSRPRSASQREECGISDSGEGRTMAMCYQ